MNDPQLKHETLMFSGEELASRMLHDPRELVIIDVRPYSAFAMSHILGAINVRLSRILLRRLAQGKLPVEDLLEAPHKSIFLDRVDVAVVVVYDEDGLQSNDIDAKVAVLNALKAAGHRTACLDCHLSEFNAAYPQLVEAEEIAATALAVPQSQAVLPSPAKIRINNLAPTEILPNLYIGARKDATNAATLAELHIECIVNVTKDCPNAFEGTVEYLQIPVEDHWSQDLIHYMETAIDFIDRARRANKAVLVHCFAGISRSPSITIAYVMRDQKMSLSDAYNFVKLKRPAISPHLDFLGELMAFEQRTQQGPLATNPLATRSISDPEKRVSSLLSDSCPWLQASVMSTTPDSLCDHANMTVDGGVRSSTASPPWLAAFTAAQEVQTTSTTEHQKTGMEITSSPDSGLVTEQATIPFVLAPVPKCMRRSASSNHVPAALASLRSSPPPSAFITPHYSTFVLADQ